MPDWIYPVEPPDTSAGRGYIPGNHLGIDYAPLPVGSPVYASSGGTVTYVADETGGFGSVVVITRADLARSLYAHLSRVDVGNGDVVEQGAVIGLSGGAKGAPGAGNSSGPHLHFQIMEPGVGNSVNTLDPAPLLDYPTPVDPTGPATMEVGKVYRLSQDAPGVADAGSYWSYTTSRWIAHAGLSAGVAAQDIDAAAFMAVRAEQEAFRKLLAGGVVSGGGVGGAGKLTVTLTGEAVPT